jgi:hypothetical protein
MRVPIDRVKPAPYPRDLPLGWHEAKESPVEPRQTEEDDATEYVLERLMSHGAEEVGRPVVRVIWAGYDSLYDTWEDPRLLSPLVRRYERRRKVTLLPATMELESPPTF